MFDFAWSEILLIAAVALIVIGPKDLPVALKAVAKCLRKARELASEFRQQFDEMLRASEVSEVKKQFDDVTSWPPRETSATNNSGGTDDSKSMTHAHVPPHFSQESVSYDAADGSEDEEEELQEREAALQKLLARAPSEIPPQAARCILRDREFLFPPSVIPPRYVRHGQERVRPQPLFEGDIEKAP